MKALTRPAMSTYSEELMSIFVMFSEGLAAALKVTEANDVQRIPPIFNNASVASFKY